MNRHPLLNRPRDLGLYLGVLCLVGVLLAKLALGDGSPWRDAALLGLPLGFVLACLMIPTWWIHGDLALKLSALPRWLGTQVVLAALATFALVWLARGWSRLTEDLFAAAGLAERLQSHEPQWWIAGLLLYLAALLLHYLVAMAAASRAAENRARGLQIRAREARLKAFKAQVDPHFLFNSLNSLSALCGFDPAGARRMALLLAGFFRGSVEAGRKEWLPLCEELELMKNYLEIEKVRFEDRLRVEWETDEKARQCLIPTFLLQPLVENAVKHGIASLVEGGVVRLEAQFDDGRLAVNVQNPCDPDRPKTRGAGTGLANVQGRLLTLYGPEARFEIEESADSFQVSLSFPVGEKLAVGEEPMKENANG